MPLAITNAPASAPETVSPKVSRPAWAVLALTAATGALQVITPEMLDFLGDWRATAYMLVGVLLQVIVGYRAPDPARTGGDETPASEPDLPDDDALSVVG